MKLRVFEAFSGVGSQRMALRNIGVDHEVVAIADIDKFALKSYEAIHGDCPNLGDISQIETSDIPDHDLFTYSFPCFIEGTLVMTSNGCKAIEDITEDDFVLTHTNKYQKVVKPMVNEANHIYKLSSTASEDLYVTEEHPFYVRKKTKVWDNENRTSKRVFESAEWVKTKDLTKDYYLGSAINNKSELPTWGGVVFNGAFGHEVKQNELSKLFANEDFWWLVGRFIGDGWTREYTAQGKHDERFVLCCGKHKNCLEDVKNVLDRLPFSYHITEERTTYKFQIVNKELARYCYQFGKGASNKHLTSDIINLPINLLKYFLDGYLTSDGHLDKNGYYKISSVSQKLIYDTSQCIMKVYKTPVSVYRTKRNPTCIIEGRLVNQKDVYEVKFKKDKRKQDKSFYEDGYVWHPINKLEKLEYNGLVYNMEVENDNSYVVQNIIAHNCQDISVAGKQLGLSEGAGTRSSLLWECAKVIEVKRPKYLLLENVKNLVGKKHKADFDKWLDWLEKQGYTNYWQVLNAKNYGVPQNRERVFVVSILGEHKPYEFPKSTALTRAVKDVLEDEVDEKYYINKPFHLVDKGIVKTEFPNINKVILEKEQLENTTSKHSLEIDKSKLSPDGATVCETRCDEGVRYFKDNICGTLRTINAGGDKHVIQREEYNYKVRKLTPLECWRLMGFSDDDFNKAKNDGISNSQLYKQAGNSIVVPVLEGIFRNMFISN